jgi:hypothetical protein
MSWTPAARRLAAVLAPSEPTVLVISVQPRQHVGGDETLLSPGIEQMVVAEQVRHHTRAAA